MGVLYDEGGILFDNGGLIYSDNPEDCLCCNPTSSSSSSSSSSLSESSDSTCGYYTFSATFDGSPIDVTIEGGIASISGSWESTGPGPGFSGDYSASITGLPEECCEGTTSTVEFEFEYTEDSADYSTTSGGAEIDSCGESDSETYSNQQVTEIRTIDIACCDDGNASASMQPKIAFQAHDLIISWEFHLY